VRNAYSAVARHVWRRAVRVADGHAHDADRVGDAAERWGHARDAPAGPDDDLAVDPLAQQPVGRADVVLALGRDGRGLDAETRSAHRPRGLVDHAVVGLAAMLERQVEALEVERHPEQVGVQHAQRLVEELLACLVALEDGDRQRVCHRGSRLSRPRPPVPFPA
jgi:hypothetical protein